MFKSLASVIAASALDKLCSPFIFKSLIGIIFSNLFISQTMYPSRTYVPFTFCFVEK